MYFPDFIINEKTIVEVKGLGLYYKKKLRSSLFSSGEDYLVLFSDDEILKTNYLKARKWHHANKKEKKN